MIVGKSLFSIPNDGRSCKKMADEQQKNPPLPSAVFVFFSNSTLSPMIAKPLSMVEGKNNLHGKCIKTGYEESSPPLA